MFPLIKTIDDVLPAILGSDEFYVKQDLALGYQVINYHVNFGLATFPSLNVDDPDERLRRQLRRECRGLVFTDNGLILRRRYRKFFNVGEHPDSMINDIDLRQPHLILDKLDGRMITPLVLKNEIHWGTKMGVTEAAEHASYFAHRHPKLNSLAKIAHEFNLTPIFEWCRRKNRIVLDYPEDMLVLTACRWNTSGDYLPYDTLQKLSKQFEVPCVRALPGRATSMRDLMETTRALERSEGYVLRFASGEMFKIKADKYILLHKTKESVSLEKNVLRAVVSDQADDVIAHVEESLRDEIDSYRNAVLTNIFRVAGHVRLEVDRYAHLSQKDFALNVVPNVPDELKPILFKVRKGMDPVVALKEYVLNNCSTKNTVESTRWLIQATYMDREINAEGS